MSRAQADGSETGRGCVGEWQSFLFKGDMTGTKAMIRADHRGHTRPHTRPGNELTAVTQHFHRTCLSLYLDRLSDDCQSTSLRLNQAGDRL